MSTTISVTQTETRTEIETKFSTEVEQDKHNIAVTNALSNEKVKKRAYEDVKNLAAIVRRIRVLLKQVDDDLIKFDQEDFKDKENKVIHLRAAWTPKIEVRTLFLRPHH